MRRCLMTKSGQTGHRFFSGLRSSSSGIKRQVYRYVFILFLYFSFICVAVKYTQTQKLLNSKTNTHESMTKVHKLICIAKVIFREKYCYSYPLSVIGMGVFYQSMMMLREEVNRLILQFYLKVPHFTKLSCCSLKMNYCRPLLSSTTMTRNLHVALKNSLFNVFSKTVTNNL